MGLIAKHTTHWVLKKGHLDLLFLLDLQLFLLPQCFNVLFELKYAVKYGVDKAFIRQQCRDTRMLCTR